MPQINKEAIPELYRDGLMTIYQLYQNSEYSRAEVRQLILDAGVEIRPKGNPKGNKEETYGGAPVRGNPVVPARLEPLWIEELDRHPNGRSAGVQEAVQQWVQRRKRKQKLEVKQDLTPSET